MFLKFRHIFFFFGQSDTLSKIDSSHSYKHIAVNNFDNHNVKKLDPAMKFHICP